MDDNTKPISLFWIVLAGITIIATLTGFPLLFIFAPTAGTFLDFIDISDEDRLSQHQPSGAPSSNINLNFPTPAINITIPEMGNCIDEYIKSQVGEAGLYGQGETIAENGRDINVNPAFIVAIAQAESALGTYIPEAGNYNYWSFLPPPDRHHDFNNWEESINKHTLFLKEYLDRGQTTFTTIGNGLGGTYVPFNNTKYAKNNCELAIVGNMAYAPCGIRTTFDTNGNKIITEYGTPNDPNDTLGVNGNWIPNVSYFFDQIATKCGYFAPRPTGYTWCMPTDASIITATFLDPEYRRILGYDHYGIDYAPANSAEKQVYAAADGIVTKINNTCPRGSRNDSCGQYFGNHIIVDHLNGYETIYAHLELNTLTITTIGTRVAKKQPLALIDSSGNSDGDHLHFEVRYNGTALDPETLPLSDCDVIDDCSDIGQKSVDFAIAQLGKSFDSNNNIGPIDGASFDAAGLVGSAWHYATNNNRYYHSYIGSFENNGDIEIFEPIDLLNEINPGYAVYGGDYYGTQSPTTDYQHMGIYVGSISYNGTDYQNAVIEASSYEDAIIVKEYRDGPWDDNIYARPVDCNI